MQVIFNIPDEFAVQLSASGEDTSRIALEAFALEIVVADTSLLNCLILIARIDILEVLYGRILIPHAVHDEMLSPKLRRSAHSACFARRITRDCSICAHR